MQGQVSIFFIILIMVCEILYAPHLDADELTARQIMEKVELQRIVKNRGYDMIMTLIDHNGQSQKRVFKIFSKTFGDVKKQIMLVISPPRLKDSGFLIFDYTDTKREDEQWIYMPSIGKPKRIALADRDDSFMGSDLNYSDLTSKPIDEYHYRILKETTLKGVDVWYIESFPVSEDVMEKTGYKKSVLAVQKSNYAVIRIKTWANDNRTIKIHDLNEFINIDNVWIPRDILIVSRVGKITQHMTRLKFENIQMGHEFPDHLFTIRTLTKGFFGGWQAD